MTSLPTLTHNDAAHTLVSPSEPLALRDSRRVQFSGSGAIQIRVLFDNLPGFSMERHTVLSVSTAHQCAHGREVIRSL